MNNFLLGKPEDSIAAGAEKCVSKVGIAMPLILFPSDAITYFNDQFQLPAVKIDNMVSDRILPSEPYAVRPL